jgi:glycosyltransferase involved in cell wall biosynthesis
MALSATAPTATRHIVQCARTIGPGFGVSGPAFQLERAFVSLGCSCERFTLENLGIRADAGKATGPAMGLFNFWRDIVVFSTLGSAVLWWRFRRHTPEDGTVVICHVDALYGDLFVVRSLHKGFLQQHPSRTAMLIRNPLHALVLARDAIRFRRGVHRHVIALSEKNKQEVISLYGTPAEQISVIPNGVDLTRFQPSEVARRDVRARLSLPDDAFAAVFVGHEFERKGLGAVLEAVRLLAGRGIVVHLIVAGGDDSSRFEREFSDLSDRVRYVGHRTDVERYYAAADVFVMPASFDISPLVGPEALACGLPILMTRVGGVSEYLLDGQNGWFIERDAGDLSGKLEALAKNRGRREEMSQRARSSVADRDWLVIARRFLELMDRLFPLSTHARVERGLTQERQGADREAHVNRRS